MDKYHNLGQLPIHLLTAFPKFSSVPRSQFEDYLYYVCVFGDFTVVTITLVTGFANIHANKPVVFLVLDILILIIILHL